MKYVFLQRIAVLTFTIIAVLSTAGFCTFNGTTGGSTKVVYGVLKKDPKVRSDGFVKANAVKNLDGQNDDQGLTNLSIIKTHQVNDKILYSLTREKGLFKSMDGGVLWERVYIFPVGGGDQQQIKVNDSITILDFDVDPNFGQIVYAAVLENKLSKIYRSLDSGQTFSEIYTEIQTKENITFVRVDPLNSMNVFAIIGGGALIRSTDAGLTWEKIQNFDDDPIDMKFVPEFDQMFYILFVKQGLVYSKDNGSNWENLSFYRSPATVIGDEQPKQGLENNLTTKEKTKLKFGRFEKLIPITAGLNFDYKTKRSSNPNGPKGWMLIADKQMWFAENLNSDFTKLVLPSQADQYELYDLAPDPQSGLDKIYVSVNNKLFLTTNRGRTWATSDMINLLPVDGEGRAYSQTQNGKNVKMYTQEPGNISQILIDKNNPEIIYLSLVNTKARRNNGFLVF
jgi:hypothetical protein